MANLIELPKNWVCDGSELKPKSGANSSNTWILSGKEIKPKSGANSSNTYEANKQPILVIAGQLLFRLW